MLRKNLRKYSVLDRSVISRNKIITFRHVTELCQRKCFRTSVRKKRPFINGFFLQCTVSFLVIVVQSSVTNPLRDVKF